MPPLRPPRVSCVCNGRVSSTRSLYPLSFSRSSLFLVAAAASLGRRSWRAAPPPPRARGAARFPPFPPAWGAGEALDGAARGARRRGSGGALPASGANEACPVRTRRPRGSSRFPSGFCAHAPPLESLVALPAPRMVSARPVWSPRACAASRAPGSSGARARAFPPRGLPRPAPPAAGPGAAGDAALLPGRARALRRPLCSSPASRGSAPGAVGAGRLGTRARSPRAEVSGREGTGPRGGRGSVLGKGWNPVELRSPVWHPVGSVQGQLRVFCDGVLRTSSPFSLGPDRAGRAVKSARRVTCLRCLGFEMIGFNLN